MFRSLWRGWRTARGREGRAAAYVAVLTAEPPAEDVALAHRARHRRRRRPRALGAALRAPRARPGDGAARRARRPHRVRGGARARGGDARRSRRRAGPAADRVAPAQRAAARVRGGGRRAASAPGTGHHLGRALLDFAGRSAPASEELIARAGDIASRYLEEANLALRDCYGAAALPERRRPLRDGGEALSAGCTKGAGGAASRITHSLMFPRSAEGGTRTPTRLPSLAPEASASTNSTTSAGRQS